MVETSRAAIERYGITEERGFLPNEDPLEQFDVDGHRSAVGSYLAALEELAERLPDLLEAGEVRPEVEALPEPPDSLLEALSEAEILRLCLLSGFIASGYVNQIDSNPVDKLPAGVAIPLYRASETLGRKPMLSYDYICLHNFRRLDDDGGLTLDNLDTLQQFTNLPDERWFVIIHVAIESAAGPGLVATANAQTAAREGDQEQVRESLLRLAESIRTQTEHMSRMTERNEPDVFATEFRPYYGTFDDIVYEGVPELGGEPQSYRGGSGAQSCVLPSLDSALGIEHASTELLENLLDMRTYMPADYRAVIDAFEADVDLREYVLETGAPELEDAFNECIDALQRFRNVHFGQVIQYIRAPTGESTGTGGTDYMEFLNGMGEETVEHKV
jgi:indoleamine 2,3-dioxygenase